MSIQIEDLLAMIKQRQLDPDYIPVLPTTAAQATYFMVAGHLISKAAYEQDNLTTSAIIKFATTIEAAPPTHTRTDAEVKAIFDAFNMAFRVAITRNKQRIERNGQVISSFKTFHKAHEIVSPDQSKLDLLILTYEYRFNHIVDTAVADLLKDLA